MSPHDSRELVDRMQAIWPSPRWSTATIEEYERVLVGGDRTVALAALETLRDNRSTRPSIADLQAALRAALIDSAEPDEEAPRRPSRVGMPTREQVHEIVERTKATAREAGTRVKTLRRAS